jgi:hypothetical protein
MVHAPQDMVGIQHDLMAGNPLDVGYETNATAILLQRRVVESLGFWKTDTIRHERIP